MSNSTPHFWPSRRNWLPVLLGLLGLAGFYATSFYNFLLFHSLAEAFSIVIAIAVFAIFWNTRHLLHNGFYLVIGFGCLFGGLFDLIYIFAYPGMLVFPYSDGNLALQAKTVAQSYVSLSCVAAFPFLRRKINQELALFVYGAIAAIAVVAIFWGYFPDCYVEGVGITNFERFGLVISCSAYLVALVLLVRHRSEFDRSVFPILAATLITFMVQDAFSAVAMEISGPARTAAHLCQVVALYFVYKVFVEVGLRKPYDLLFRSQRQSAEELRRSNETLRQRAGQLRALASELTLTEQRERRRLAQILHDHLQQILVAAKMQVTVAYRKVKDQAAAPLFQKLDELLDQSIAESRSLTVELSPPVLFDRGLIGGLEWLARRFLEKHQLSVSLELDPEAEPADEATRIFLFHAARELLFNTVKHAGARSARLGLTQLEDHRLRLVVADDGRGFDPSIHRNGGAGSGFGLFSMQERLELIGGRMEVRSAPGEGTRVVIDVAGGRPMLVPEAAAAASAVCEATPEASCSTRIRVLVADDHAILRQGLVGILTEHAQIEVVGEAKHGLEAVEMALQIRPDVILMDITMPCLNGIEATRRLTPELPGVRVIGLSMHEGDDMARAMLEAGAIAYLNKSEAADTLIAAILAQGSNGQKGAVRE